MSAPKPEIGPDEACGPSDETALITVDGRVSDALGLALMQRGLRGAVVHRVGDLDDLDKSVRAGRTRRVIVERAEDVLAGIWDEQLHLDRWPAGGAEIELLDGSCFSEGGPAGRMARHWMRWNAARRRRNAAMGAAVSVLVLFAVYVVNEVLAGRR
jgi:hypothetical protein